MEYRNEKKLGIQQEKLSHNHSNKLKERNKTRRGNWKKSKGKISKSFNFSILGTNCNGILNKQDSLKAAMDTFKPTIVTLQETKSRKHGNIRLPGYQIFEKIRKGGNGGGLLTAADENINPVLVSTGKDDETEIITIQVEVGKYSIRIVNGYGPQEDEYGNGKDKIYKFWQELEEEILEAKDNNCLVVVQIDANAKIGKDKIRDDPNTVTANGKILLDICERQNLTILNTLDTCKGVITRERITVNSIEQSVIDYVIVCKDMENYLEKMQIDEDRTYVLTKYGKKTVRSDHNILFSKFSIQYKLKKETHRKEIFLLKDKKSQENFLKETSSWDSLSQSFSENRTFPHNANVFFRKLMGKIRKCFRKIRITKGGKQTRCQTNPTQENIKLSSELQSFLKSCKCITSRKVAEEKLKEVELFLNERCYKKNAEITKEFIKAAENERGDFSQLKLWKLKQKLYPRACDPPMAKRDTEGNLITSPESLKNLYLKTYQERLKNRNMKPTLLDIYYLKTELWRSRLQELKMKKTIPWTKEQLRTAIKSLKKNKTADPNGIINELLMNDCAGEDLEEAIGILMNKIKETFHLPEYMMRENITTIFKNKGSRLDMKNDRGIFLLTSLKKTLDKLIYIDKFKNIDKNMSCSNIGARRGRNVKDHLFIIYGIINSVINGDEKCIDIQIYDLEQAFDSLWLEECMNDTFDTLDEEYRDDKVALLYKSNVTNLVAVNTPYGETARINVPKIVQQGGTWGPSLCSNTVDTIGKKIQNRGAYSYKYKNVVNVLPLAMVDDINAIAVCGIESVELNTYINTQIELKKLRFHVPDQHGKSKCHKLHVGKNSNTCPQLKVHGTVMECVQEDMYLGDLISSDGKNKKNIDKRISKGLGIITQIMNLLDIISFGSHYIEIALLLRESMFINGVLFNAEVWYGLTKAEVGEFEKLDRLLLRRILGTPVSTPQEAMYLELGIIPIGMVIKVRRIMYLHNLLRRNKQEMLSKFFWTQFNNPVKGDWTETVMDNIKDLEITEDLDVIKSKTKDTFKKHVKQKAREAALELLLKKKSKHSKLNNLEYTELTIQNYFKSKGISKEQARLIFKFRSRMVLFGQNYRGGQEAVPCPLCEEHPDSQTLLLECPFIKKHFPQQGIDITNIYSDNVDEETVKTLEAAMTIRNMYLNDKREN